jgi:hypothetical protein
MLRHRHAAFGHMIGIIHAERQDLSRPINWRFEPNARIINRSLRSAL